MFNVCISKCSGVCDMHHIYTIKNAAYIIIQGAAEIPPRLDKLRAASSSQGHSKYVVIVSHKDHIQMSHLSYVLYHFKGVLVALLFYNSSCIYIQLIYFKQQFEFP